MPNEGVHRNDDARQRTIPRHARLSTIRDCCGAMMLRKLIDDMIQTSSADCKQDHSGRIRPATGVLVCSGCMRMSCREPMCGRTRLCQHAAAQAWTPCPHAAKGRILGEAAVAPARRGICLRHLRPGPPRESSRRIRLMKVLATAQLVLPAMWPGSTANLYREGRRCICVPVVPSRNQCRQAQYSRKVMAVPHVVPKRSSSVHPLC